MAPYAGRRRHERPCRSRWLVVRLTYIVINTVRHRMILGYGDKRTEQFAEGGFVAAFQGFEQQAAKRLSILNAAPSLETLRGLPSNRSTQGRQGWRVFDPHQPAMAYLLRLARRPTWPDRS